MKNLPPWGSKWRRTERLQIGSATETRTVIDHTLGGNVVYVSGRLTRLSKCRPSQCTGSEWQEWQRKAVEITEH